MNKLRLFIITARWIFIIAGFVLILAPASWWPTYYRPIPMGLMAIGYSFLIALPQLVFKKASSKTLKIFQAVLAGNLLLCSLGSLGLWSTSIGGFLGYDKLVHFTFSGSMMVSSALLFNSGNSWSLKKTSLIIAIIIALSGVAWEFIEYFFAAYFHFGYFGSLFDHDSKFDLITNICGVAVGLIIILIYSISKPSDKPAF